MGDREENEDFLRKALEDTCPEGNVVTHWLMVMETFDGEEQNLHVASSDSVTPWMALGMIEAAKRIVNENEND